MATELKTKRAFQDLEDAGKVLEGIVDEARVQAHLGAMELEDRARPYLDAVGTATRQAASGCCPR